MDIQLFDFEKNILKGKEKEKIMLSDDEINEKYEIGEARIVTEQGSIKLPLVKEIFSSDKYERKPIYQRRITWDTKKRSRLIESFMYEIDFGKYEVMDGLQRISTIIDFYTDVFELEGLTEWPELNGKKYSELPKKIKEGIDRRQISMVSLLKESAKTLMQEQKMKRMVFERLNTGGVKLEEQEIRNALYDGEFNRMCKRLSENKTFRKLWGIPVDIKNDDNLKELDNLDIVDSLDVTEELATNNLYMRMYDVELVLRFFSMRHVKEFSGQLADFLDRCLIVGNELLEQDKDKIKLFEELFLTTIEKANALFGTDAFCQYKEIRGKLKWSKPQKMIYDAMMLSLTKYEIDLNYDFEKIHIKKYMEKKYVEKMELFNGKKQSKNDILERMIFFDEVIHNILEGKINE